MSGLFVPRGAGLGTELGNINLAAGVGPKIATQFTPMSLPGQLGWWTPRLSALWQDSGRTTPVTANNDPVGAIDDLFGSNHLLQPDNTGYRPLYKTNQQNGKPGLSFDGANDYLKAAFTRNSPETLAFVVKTNTLSSFTRVFEGAGTNTGSFFYSDVGGFNPCSLYAGSTLNHAGAAAGSYQIVTVVMNGASSVIRINGTEVTGDIGATAFGNALVVGSTYALPTQPLNGTLLELIHYSGAKNAAQRAQLESYLNSVYTVF